jgi:uncharacterized protein (TIGR02145 family)
MRASNYIEKSSAEGSSSSVAAVEPSSSSGYEETSSSSVEQSSSSVQSSSSLAQSSSSSAPLCGEVQYNPDTEFCSGTEVLGKCGGTEEYNPATEACCGSGKYTKATQYCSNGTKKEYGSVADNQGKYYKTVVIGSQTWMAENLNSVASGSKCGDGSGLSNNNTSTCNTYGRLYDWTTAMGFELYCKTTDCSSQIQAKHRGVCPSDWHIPSDAEWDVLVTFVGGNTAGTNLKAVSRWNDYEGTSGNGTDDYGFSALPGGGGYSLDGDFSGVGRYGNWWSATEYTSYYAAYGRFMGYDYSYVNRSGSPKSDFLSVRCVKD